MAVRISVHRAGAQKVLVARSKQLEKALGKSSGSAPQPIMCTFEYLLKK